jgi:hypothetical protein
VAFRSSRVEELRCFKLEEIPVVQNIAVKINRDSSQASLQIRHRLFSRNLFASYPEFQPMDSIIAFHVSVFATAPGHSESRFYLATYDVTDKMLTASLQTIGNPAKKIISLIENSGEQIDGGRGRTVPRPVRPSLPRRAPCPRANAATLLTKRKVRPSNP